MNTLRDHIEALQQQWQAFGQRQLPEQRPLLTQLRPPSQIDEVDSAGSEEAIAVAMHNRARAAHGIDPLQWSDTLVQAAQLHANHIARIGRLEHCNSREQGENLFVSFRDATLRDAVHMWLDEEKHYHDQRIGEGDLTKYGHYTNVFGEAQRT
ncbi:hypothetical protein LTR56_014308 [Elasticomyces elasticus]|nr:hypothetical protein LTR22_024718 [Elasticomyces elasticus]KAK3636145.1 hypothetical protein LTR56_014308 [Elasticomyces elasticus]KAK4916564.1 hypothetical protein LTR49_015397 [Elasticomyces elasticus]KAK5756199.1 hypothetical protein LTS12_013752 [Elasticomyces elasticus]